MEALKNFTLGLLLAAILMGPAVWAQAGHLVRAGLSAAAGAFGHKALSVPISATARPALPHLR